MRRSCGAASRVANLLASDANDGGWRLLLEDLEPGDTARKRAFRGAEIGPCLRWLASFHATFLGVEPTGLWVEGTYWHLATRPDELVAIDEPDLRDAAPAIDARLRGARHRTLVGVSLSHVLIGVYVAFFLGLPMMTHR